MAKQDRAAKKEAAKQKRQASSARRKQLFEAFKMQRREDRLLVPLMLAVLLGTAVVAFLLGLVWGLQWFFLPVGVVLGALGAVIIFGRRVQANVYKKASGQPGAAGWALENMRGKWQLAQGVAGTSQLDAVHRVIGKPGVVLVGEGSPNRVKNLMSQEKKRISRLVGDTPIYEFIVGDEQDQVPLSKLQSKIMKLPRNINAGQIDSLDKRLEAIGNRGTAAPKGPAPQGAKMRNMQRATRRK
ncbi:MULTISPECIES: DUF4191 domain-containing protein [Actinopolyspora]|uniref:DUF4191 domain-containing protein n=1 Tax=Actinopolyspora saharensis TaxID=995062 RepID=A0A1H0XUP8_9ACTN|nr:MULTISPECIES: DUF4191 domain-containing protein [Actinopolyspora]NHD17323.1 DUF4191 domain-containing protein [Actinopolyspora sp. BKK2]NHE76944.1 DUF4191 domain-containing protein [Actinopolyspora sp. BKK1]SDQ06376.1 protein of unknown function [Actinopolyspora saharensis]